MRNAVVLVLTVLVIVMENNQIFVSADCCYHDDGKCHDGTFPTPFCGYGPCNLWGCNCDGGCRDGRRRRDVQPQAKNGTDIFLLADMDKDGRLSPEEIDVWMSKKSHEAFKLADKNGDGFLKGDEIDTKFKSVVLKKKK